MRKRISASLVVMAALAAGITLRTADAAHTQLAAGGTTIYVDAQYGYSFAYPATWSVRRRRPMYLRALMRLSRTGTILLSPDHNAGMIAVAGRGAYGQLQLVTLERDALVQMLRPAAAIHYASGAMNGVTYQLAQMYGGFYDRGSHVAIMDQLYMATAHGPYTYVFAIGVKQHVSSTVTQETQAAALIRSLVVR